MKDDALENQLLTLSTSHANEPPGHPLPSLKQLLFLGPCSV